MLARRVLTGKGELVSVGLPGNVLIVLVGEKGRFVVPGNSLRLRTNSGLLVVSRDGAGWGVYPYTRILHCNPT